MAKCSGEECTKVHFHQPCIGLTGVPPADWLCDECEGKKQDGKHLIYITICHNIDFFKRFQRWYYDVLIDSIVYQEFLEMILSFATSNVFQF